MKMGQASIIGALITPALLLFLGWLILGGIVAWSGQTQILVIIGVAIWLLLRKK